MAQTEISNLRIAGIASAVPSSTRDISEIIAAFGEEAAKKIADMSGVRVRRTVPHDGSLCTSDLCAAAAGKLLHELGWSPDSIDGLIFVSQTPDYILPATSCILQARLGLPKGCAAFDVNLGCSGYVYGLWLAAQMLAAGGCKRVLLLAGETASRIAGPEDRAVAPLFGDAGTATALERAPNAPPMWFDLGTDGMGWDKLIVPAGGFRNPRTAETAKRRLREDGNTRSDEELFMSGADIFTFTLREVPALIQNALKQSGWTASDVGAYVMHQANRFMLQQISKKAKLAPEHVVFALEEFGNTSSASIPLAITARLAPSLRETALKVVLAGFGVGYSWGSACLTLGPIIVSDLVIVEPQERVNDLQPA